MSLIPGRARATRKGGMQDNEADSGELLALALPRNAAVTSENLSARANVLGKIKRAHNKSYPAGAVHHPSSHHPSSAEQRSPGSADKFEAALIRQRMSKGKIPPTPNLDALVNHKAETRGVESKNLSSKATTKADYQPTILDKLISFIARMLKQLDDLLSKRSDTADVRTKKEPGKSAPRGILARLLRRKP